jgi:glycosyltransferase involved in cell wall biosynthesis
VAADRLDVLILGPVPPPLGGVSAHVDQLGRLLRARGLRVGILDHYGASPGADRHGAGDVVGALRRNPVRYWAAVGRHRSDVLHLHYSHWLSLVAVALRRHGDRRLVVTLHGHDAVVAVGARHGLRGAVTRWALGRFDEVIAVSREVAAGVAANVRGRRLHVIPAFLGPPPDGHARPLAPRLEHFLKDERPTLVASCSRLPPGRGGPDPYGLDTAVEAFGLLAGRHPGLRLALLLGRPPSSAAERAYVDGLLARAAGAGGAGRVAVAVGEPLVSAFRHEVILLRPTRSEGDAVSVREALAAGVPVVASDVARRPPGTIVCGAGADALATAVLPLLGDRAGPRPGPAAGGEGAAHLDEILAVYAGPLSRR